MAVEADCVRYWSAQDAAYPWKIRWLAKWDFLNFNDALLLCKVPAQFPLTLGALSNFVCGVGVYGTLTAGTTVAAAVYTTTSGELYGQTGVGTHKNVVGQESMSWSGFELPVPLRMTGSTYLANLRVTDYGAADDLNVTVWGYYAEKAPTGNVEPMPIAPVSLEGYKWPMERKRY